MQSIGRKLYMKWGDKIVAVEFLAENAEQFKARTHIEVTDNKSVVCEVADVFGERIEREIAPVLVEPNYYQQESLGQFISQVKMITEKDLDNLAIGSGIPLDICDNSVAQIQGWGNPNDWKDSFDDGFLGYLEVPNKKHEILHNYCQLSFIGFNGANEKTYVPVFLFKSENQFFDSEPNEKFVEKPWVVLFHGNDNSSSGQRFVSKMEAEIFLKDGFKCGINKKLEFYNS